MSAAPVSLPGDSRAGPGCFILVAGPSGAGKDTLIGLAREACPDDGRIVFPQRIVTRAASAAERNGTLRPDEFAAASAGGAFAVQWQAHGLYYGLPRTLLEDLRLGRTVVANVSRGAIGEVRSRFDRTLVVLVTAPPAILAARLSARARISDGSLAERLARRVDFGAPDIVIDNIGDPHFHARELLAAIANRTQTARPAPP